MDARNSADIPGDVKHVRTADGLVHQVVVGGPVCNFYFQSFLQAIAKICIDTQDLCNAQVPGTHITMDPVSCLTCLSGDTSRGPQRLSDEDLLKACDILDKYTKIKTTPTE